MAAHKIFVFSNVRGGGEGPCVAMADDGIVLGSHWCSNETYARYDLGVEPGTRADRHECYAAHFPDGYELEFVPSRSLRQHAGLMAAIALNAQPKDQP